jgi:hypothetical protein
LNRQQNLPPKVFALMAARRATGEQRRLIMKNKLIRGVAGGVLAAVLAATAADAQAPPAAQPGPAAPQRQVAQLTPGRLDQMLAPIALYPDDLIVQILMAATYPLDVVEAARWVQDPRNAKLKGDQLFAGLQQQDWDASVKSLAPFPGILDMMDVNLEWTERLGEAFLADPRAVMEAIQRLRRRAQAAVRLVSTPQAIVQTAPEQITIEPPSPEIVYVPVCDPSIVYGGWPYPDYPPYSFGDFFNGASAGGFGCGWVGWPIVAPLWGWAALVFRDRHIHIYPDRLVLIDKNRPPIDGEEWRHDPTHRGNVPYRDAELAARYGGAAPNREILRAFHDYPTGSPSRIDGPGARPPTVMEQGPSLEGIDPDRGAFVPRAFEPFGGGAGMGARERGFSGRPLAPIGAPRGGGPDIPPLAGAGIRPPPSPGGATRAAPFLHGGAPAAPPLSGGMRAAPSFGVGAPILGGGMRVQ